VTGYLLDTNVISEPDKPRPNAGVIAWLGAINEGRLFISVLSIGEIRARIEQVEGAVKKARLETFLSALRARFGDRMLTFDNEVAERWGRLVGTLGKSGRPIQSTDAMLAATALHHDLVLVTRNERHFRVPGLSVLNPFAEA